MWRGYIDTVTKYFYDSVTFIKVKKSKEDNKKLKEFNSKLSKLEKERDITYERYTKLSDKCYKVSDSIGRINKRYAYTKRIKELNPNYAG